MPVFISWSGDRSKHVASALSSLLSGAIPGLPVWMSQQDIEPGLRWEDTLNRVLKTSNFGVLCLTPENLNAPWLLFEAGSLAKGISKARLVPYRLGLAPADITPPLAQFQGVDADEAGTWHLVKTLNATLKPRLPEEQLRAAFNPQWSAFSDKVAPIAGSAGPAAVREIEMERQRMRTFCEKVDGAWFERIDGEGIGLFCIRMDELHNSVRLVGGHFYDEAGQPTADYVSALARIDERSGQKGIVYLRECRRPDRDGVTWFHGYGDMWFEESGASFDQGHGTFYDGKLDDPRKMVAKSVGLRRARDAEDIRTIESGTSAERQSLARQALDRRA